MAWPRIFKDTIDAVQILSSYLELEFTAILQCVETFKLFKHVITRMTSELNDLLYGHVLFEGPLSH